MTIKKKTRRPPDNFAWPVLLPLAQKESIQTSKHLSFRNHGERRIATGGTFVAYSFYISSFAVAESWYLLATFLELFIGAQYGSNIIMNLKPLILFYISHSRQQCGFVISFLIFPLSGVYVLWLVGPDVSGGSTSSWYVHTIVCENCCFDYSSRMIRLGTALNLYCRF